MALLLFLLFALLPLIQGKITFLTITHPPFSDCTNISSYSSQSSTEIYGAEIDLLRDAFALYNWVEGTDYEFYCVTNTSTLYQAMNNLTTSNQTAVVGGITMTSERIKGGLGFSQPTVSAPLPIVYLKKAKGWFFRRSLTISGWITIFGTMIGIGLLMYIYEGRKIETINTIYASFCQIFFVADYPFDSSSSKFISFFSMFVVFVVVNIFTAASTNIFQSDRSLGETLSLESLVHKQVYTNGILDIYLTQYGIKPKILLDYDPKKLPEKLDQLDIEYLVLDGPYSDYLTRKECKYYESSNAIDTLHYGVMIGNQFPEASWHTMNQAILEAKERKDFSKYTQAYYKTVNDFQNCEAVETLDDYVTLYEMRGLWYILGCGMGISFFIMAVNLMRARLNKNLSIFNLKGVRARMDRKIQRRVATVFAIQTAVSIQSMSFLKNINIEILTEWLDVMKEAFSAEIIQSTYTRIIKINEEDDDLINPKDLNFGGGMSAVFGWLKKKSIIMKKINEKRRKSSSDAKKKKRLNSHEDSKTPRNGDPKTPRNADPKTPRHGDSKTPRNDGSKTPRSAGLKRSSSFVKQSMKSFKMGDQLFKTLGTLKDKQKTFEDFEQDSKNKQHIDEYLKKLGLDKSFINKELNLSKKANNVPLLQRIFGKQGMKINKEIHNSAKVLILKKGTKLIEEAEKKKSEAAIRGTPRNTLSSNCQTPRMDPTGSPASALIKRTLHRPSSFRFKKIIQNNSQLSNSNELSVDSPWDRSLELSPVHHKERSKSKFVSNNSNNNNRKGVYSIEISNRNFFPNEIGSAGISLKPPTSKEEDFDILSQSESAFKSQRSQIQAFDFSTYDFLRLTQSKRNHLSNEESPENNL